MISAAQANSISMTARGMNASDVLVEYEIERHVKKAAMKGDTGLRLTVASVDANTIAEELAKLGYQVVQPHTHSTLMAIDITW